MKKILLFCIPALMFASSCKDLDDYDNINPKAATTVPGVSLVSNAQRMLVNTINTPDYNINPFRFYAQYWAATTYPDESQYVIETRTINRSYWDALYRDVLSDLNEGKKVITADPLLNADVKANQLAAIEVLEVYTWSVLVNTFGDIPYNEALNPDNVLPKFDDDAAIYNDLVVRLDKALGMFKPTDAAGKVIAGLGSGDLIYKGDVAKWVKFANSLKLRLGLTYADVDPAKAQTMVEAAAPNVFTSNADNAQITYLSALPNRNQLYESLVQSGRVDFVGASTLIDPMLATNDPRLNEYFKPAESSKTFVGGTYGAASNSAPSNSTPGAPLEDPTLPGVILSYSQIEFYLAEAAERGFSLTGSASGTAEAHYNKAVTASILAWGNDESEATTYLKQPTVAYETAAGDYKQKIGVQQWIALYNQPTEAWTEWRRLDSPKLVKPALAKSEIPLRLPYPSSEANLNSANYAAAASAMGGDVVTSRIFWDKL